MVKGVKPSRGNRAKQKDYFWLGGGSGNGDGLFFGLNDSEDTGTSSKQKKRANRKESAASSKAESGKPEQQPGNPSAAGAATRARPNAAVHRAPLMKISEVAAELNVSSNHVRNLIDEGLLRKVAVGVRSVRIPRKDVEEIVRNGISR